MNNNSQRVLRGIGWLEVIIGALGVLFSTWFIFIGVMYSFGKWMPYDDCGLGGLAVLNLFWSLPLAILFFLGIGILKLRSWMRIAQVIIFSIIFLVELFFFLILVFYSNPDFLWQIPGILISSIMIWFLSRHAVKKQFK
jgi:hypothetical protein